MVTGQSRRGTLSEASQMADLILQLRRRVENLELTLANRDPIRRIIPAVSEAEMLSKGGRPGDIMIRSDDHHVYGLVVAPGSEIGNWRQIGNEANIPLGDLADETLSRLVPAATMVMYVGTDEPDGWKQMNGQTLTGAETLYPEFWSRIPSGWKSGANATLPNMSDRVGMGAGTTTLGATGGANSRTITAAQMPSHSHSIDHSHTGSTGSAGSHSHTGPSHSHDIGHGHSGSSGGESSHTHGVGSYSVPSGGSHTHTTVWYYIANTGTPTPIIYGSAGDGQGQIFVDWRNQVGNSDGQHSHSVSGSSGSGLSHSHSVSVNSFSGSSGPGGTGSTSPASDHSHSVSVSAHSGSSGPAGSGQAMDTTPAHLAVNFLVKVH
jgi:microcystin-dependent protein